MHPLKVSMSIMYIEIYDKCKIKEQISHVALWICNTIMKMGLVRTDDFLIFLLDTYMETAIPTLLALSLYYKLVEICLL